MTEPTKRLPILVLDFDGVIHSYSSGWKGAAVIPDPPVPGAIEFIIKAQEHFTVAIFSSRSNQEGGIKAMKTWLGGSIFANEKVRLGLAGAKDFVEHVIQWPTEKPPAMISIDDRALTFDGAWPEIRDLLRFQPWNKRTDLPPLKPLSREMYGVIRLQANIVDAFLEKLTYHEAVLGKEALKELLDVIDESLPGHEHFGECSYCEMHMGIDEAVDVSGGEGLVYMCPPCAARRDDEVRRDGTDG